MRILIDADGVLENLSQEWVLYLDEKYGRNVEYEDLKEWDMTAAFPGLTREQVYGAELEEALYDRMKPMPGAPECVKRLLDAGHEVYVVTNTPYAVIQYKMEKVIFRYFPFLSWKNIVITSNKQMIDGDILIDDGIHNLIGGTYRRLLFDAPYNRDFDEKTHGIVRVKNWQEIEAEIAAAEQSCRERISDGLQAM